MIRTLLAAVLLSATCAMHAQWVGGGIFSTVNHFQACAFHSLDTGLFVYGANNPGPGSFATEGGIILTDDGDMSGGYYLWYQPSTNLEDIDVKNTANGPLYMAAGHRLYGRSIVVRPYDFPAYPIAFDSVGTADGQYYRALRMRNDLVAFVAGGTSTGDGVIDMSADTGATWTNVAVLPGQPVSRLHFVDDNLAFAATGGYSRLVNNGLFLPDSGALYRSTNGGISWAQVHSDATAGFSDVAFRDAAVGVATRNDGAILRSTDGGDTWLPATVNLSDTVVMTAVTFRQDGVAFAAGYRPDGASGYILISTDDGQTWYENFNTSGINNSRRIYDLYFHDAAHGYASTHIKPLRTTGIITGVADAPRAAVFSILPNPAHDRLEVLLPEAAGLDATVFDAVGRALHTWRDPAAIARHTLDLSRLAAGSYLLRVNGAVVPLVVE